MEPKRDDGLLPTTRSTWSSFPLQRGSSKGWLPDCRGCPPIATHSVDKAEHRPETLGRGIDGDPTARQHRSGRSGRVSAWICMQTCFVVRLTGRTNGRMQLHSAGATEPCLYHSPYTWAFPNILPLSMHAISICTQLFTVNNTLHTHVPFRARSGGYLPCMPAIRDQFCPINHRPSTICQCQAKASLECRTPLSRFGEEKKRKKESKKERCF